MKAILVLLVAALSILQLTSAFPAKLGLRQGSAAIACTQNADCKAAASDWNDCQKSAGFGPLPATHSALQNCICSSGRGNPSHPDWFSKLASCIQCIENAQGVPDSVLNPLQALDVSFCTTGEVTYYEFIIQAHIIAANAGLPLELPQAVLVSIQTAIGASNHQTSTSRPDDCASPTPQKISTQAAAVPTTAQDSKGCNYDNCLRQAIQSEDVVLSYCKTYTASVDTATSKHPGYVSMCSNSPPSISSACNCLVSAQTPSQTQTASRVPSDSHTTTNGGIATTKAKPSIHTVTGWTTTTIYVTPPLGGDSSTTSGTLSTNCTTALSKSSTPVMKPSTSEFSSSFRTSSSPPVQCPASTRTSSSAPVHSSTSVHTSCPASSKSSTAIQTLSTTVTKSSSVTPSSTSTSAASAVATWITLPASNEMKACAASSDCVTAGNIYSQCSKDQVNGNQTMSWNCLCKANIDGWKSSVTNCGACVAKNLPVAPPGGYPSKILVPTLSALVNVLCNYTDPIYKDEAISSLDRSGLVVTSGFESPVEFFNMSLLDHPISPKSPTSSGISLSSRTSTTQATVTASTSKIISSSSSSSSSSKAPAPSRASTGIHTALSTQATISGQATPTKWITLPATEAMKKCQASDCQPAAKIYNTCMATKLSGTNQGPIFDCFCTANKVQWQSTLSSCTKCIAAALLAQNPGTQLQSNVLNQQVELIRSLYCNQTEANAANRVLEILKDFGQIATASFESPINFFNMTLLTAAIAPFAKRDTGPLLLEISGGFQN